MTVVSVEKDFDDLKSRDGGDIPIVVGDGLARLFPPAEPSVPLELLSAQTFKSGVLNPSYAKAAD